MDLPIGRPGAEENLLIALPTRGFPGISFKEKRTSSARIRSLPIEIIHERDSRTATPSK